MEKLLLKDVADVKLCIAVSSKGKAIEKAVKWITLASLLPFNGMGELMLSSEYCPEEDLKVKNRDIIMRRIAPTGINYIVKDMDAYVYNNLVIISARGNVNSDYLAAYLDVNIENYVKGLASGAAVPSIGRKDLLAMEIFLPDVKTQNAIGSYWLTYNEKKRLENKLSQLEQIKNREIFNIVLKKTRRV